RRRVRARTDSVTVAQVRLDGRTGDPDRVALVTDRHLLAALPIALPRARGHCAPGNREQHQPGADRKCGTVSPEHAVTPFGFTRPTVSVLTEIVPPEGAGDALGPVLFRIAYGLLTPCFRIAHVCHQRARLLK